MSVAVSEILSLLPVITIVAVSALVAFVLARGDEAARARWRR